MDTEGIIEDTEEKPYLNYMIFKISHITRYKYNKQVFLEPHTLRLRPRNDCSQKLHKFAIKVEPPQVGKSDCVDLEGNDTISLWFEGLHNELTIFTSSVVETLRKNPFDFIVHNEEALNLPISYPDYYEHFLIPYQRRDSINAEVNKLATDISEEANNQTPAFLRTLSLYICNNFEHIFRESGNPYPPEVTLAKKKGACRDLVVLFIDACRALGIAARFVSGYKNGESTNTEKHLHAWAEVYIPGGGWRGFDPSFGLAVSNTHVALASGITPESAAPISGTYRGGQATSRLEFEINIQTGRHLTD